MEEGEEEGPEAIVAEGFPERVEVVKAGERRRVQK